MANPLVIGAGLIGSYIARETNASVVDHLALDIENRLEVMSLKGFHPTTIYLCASYSNVTKAETDKQAIKVNVDGVRNVVDLAKETGARLVFLSSSYVFDGTKTTPYREHDVPNPINIYGITKLVGERMVETLEDYLIVRTCSVYGREKARKNFAYHVLDTVSTLGEPMRLNALEFSCPIHAKHLAHSIVSMPKRQGVVHINGPTAMSKYTWGGMVLTKFGMPLWLLDEYYQAKEQAAVRRPVNACLRNSDGVYVPSFQQGLEEFYLDN